MLGTRQIAPESPSWVRSWAADPHKIPIDSNGNLTTKVEGTDTWAYTWNAENQLTKVEKNGAEVARFAYDPLGRRVEKVVGGATTTYTYDYEDILREVSAGATFKHVHGPGIDEPLAREDGSGALTYLHADTLGSISKRTSQAGAVVHEYRYDAWGNIETGANEPGYSFTGREWDPEVGLYYYRSRYYDPTNARFISEDPLGLAGGQNFYRYVRNSPVNLADPFGLKECIVDQCMVGCLQRIFGEPIPNIKVIKGSKTTFFMKLIGKGDRAISHPNSIRIPATCSDFLADYWWMLHEYFHVVRQWRASPPNNLTKKKYVQDPNRWESSANDFADRNKKELEQCYADCATCPVP